MPGGAPRQNNCPSASRELRNRTTTTMRAIS